MIDESERHQNVLHTRQFHEAAYKAYWDAISTTPRGTLQLLPFDFVECVEAAGWRPGSGQIVADDVRELINVLNTWCSHLFRWEVWQAVLANYSSGEDLWSLRDEFIEPIAQCCLLRPSQVRDLLLRITTSAVHYANLICNPTTNDELEGERGRQFLSRRRLERQLCRIGAKWSGLPRFMAAVRLLDAEKYRQQTFDYRNRASHSVAPHFEEGMLGFVTRQFGHPWAHAKQEDCSYLLVEDKTRMEPYFSLGGIPPLQLIDMLEINKKEFSRAVETFSSYEALLGEMHFAFGKANNDHTAR